MPQEFRIVCCHKCQMFQVDQVKKATKWTCKICHEKQSVRKTYGRGPGSECRKHVQKLNMEQGIRQDNIHNENECFTESEYENANADSVAIQSATKTSTDQPSSRVDWSKYLEPENYSTTIKLKGIHQPSKNITFTTDRDEYSSQFNYKRKRCNHGHLEDSDHLTKRCYKDQVESSIPSNTSTKHGLLAELTSMSPPPHDDMRNMNAQVSQNSKWSKYIV